MGMLKNGLKVDVTKIEMSRSSFDLKKLSGGMIYAQSGGIIVGYKDGRGIYHGYMVSAGDIVKLLDSVAPHQPPMAAASPQGEASEG